MVLVFIRVRVMREEGGVAVRVLKEREMTALSDDYKMCINYIYIYI